MVEGPRVQAKKNKKAHQEVDNKEQSRQMLQPRPPLHDQKYSRGTRVNKKFGNKWYRGCIVDFYKKEGYYEVIYEDGEKEEYNYDEIKSMLHKPDFRNIEQTLSATKH